jgi:hypothetical protein
MNNDRSFAYFSSLPRLFPLPQSGSAFCFQCTRKRVSTRVTRHFKVPTGAPTITSTHPARGTHHFKVPAPPRVPARGTPHTRILLAQGTRHFKYPPRPGYPQGVPLPYTVLLCFSFGWLRSDFCFTGLGRILGNYVFDILFACESGSLGISYTGIFFGLHFYLLVGIRIGR